MRFGEYEANELSGYRRLNLAKLFNVILFFCKGGEFTTKLNKLLFYADFKHFKEYTVSVTGAQYAHMPFGPAPDKYAYYFATLVENGSIRVEEVEFPQGHTGENLITISEPNLSLFSASELKILASVKERFENFTSQSISDFVHEEKAYKDTQNGDLISYEYANELQL